MLVEQSYCVESPQARHRGTEQEREVSFLVKKIGGSTRSSDSGIL